MLVFRQWNNYMWNWTPHRVISNKHRIPSKLFMKFHAQWENLLQVFTTNWRKISPFRITFYINSNFTKAPVEMTVWWETPTPLQPDHFDPSLQTLQNLSWGFHAQWENLLLSTTITLENSPPGHFERALQALQTFDEVPCAVRKLTPFNYNKIWRKASPSASRLYTIKLRKAPVEMTVCWETPSHLVISNKRVQCHIKGILNYLLELLSSFDGKLLCLYRHKS